MLARGNDIIRPIKIHLSLAFSRYPWGGHASSKISGQWPRRKYWECWLEGPRESIFVMKMCIVYPPGGEVVDPRLAVLWRRERHLHVSRQVPVGVLLFVSFFVLLWLSSCSDRGARRAFAKTSRDRFPLFSPNFGFWFIASGHLLLPVSGRTCGSAVDV